MNREQDTNRRADTDGAQPPPAVSEARPALTSYRRDLPHLQRDDKTLFVTFNTLKRWKLPAVARQLVIEHCLHDHGMKYHLHAAVVMPDHVHIVMTPLRDREGTSFGLAEIMNGIKGASAHSINRALGRRGTVWQSESFDRILRSDGNVRAAAEYICQNPVRAGLCDTEEGYSQLWREWIEGA